MANNNDKQIDADVKEAEVVMDDANQAKDNRLVWIALVVLLAIVLAVSAWFYQILAQQAAQDKSAVLQTEISSLKQSLAERDQQMTLLQEQHQHLSDSLDAFMAKDSLTSADVKKTWALQEIEYLLNVANQRALLANDVQGAYQALDMASELIRALADYRLHPLRALITEEMMALDALADVDQQGIALKLQTAANHVPRLRVKKGPEVDTTIMLDEPDTVLADSGWRQAVSDIWQQLRSLVVIRHDQTGEAAVLVPEQRYFLYQNLRLQLESARLALLNSDSNSYQHSLQTAISWLEKYFTGDERDAMLNSLRDLQSKQVNITLPDISASLEWMKEYQQ